MIPVIGVPYIGNPDLLLRMVASINVEYGQLIVIDNTWDRSCPDVGTVIRSGQNYGVAASWNLIMKTAPRAPWWMIANSDLEFGPGDLPMLVETLHQQEFVLLYSMAAFALKPSVIKRVGWFDENFVPAYCEDNDFIYRCRLLGQHIEFLPASYDHYGSATIKNSDTMRWNNDRTYPLNVEYYQSKWGGLMHQEVFKTPFDRGGSPADWTLDIERLSRQMWSASIERR